MNLFKDIANIMLFILPTSKCFAFKRLMLRLAGVEIGQDVKVNGHTWFYGRGVVRIGDRTWIGPGCQFHSTSGTVIDIGADCDVAPQVIFVTGTHEFGPASRRAGTGYARDIQVGNGTWLGARCTVLGGIMVGSGSFVAAGGLVNMDIPQCSLSAGVPAKVKRIFEN